MLSFLAIHALAFSFLAIWSALVMTVVVGCFKSESKTRKLEMIIGSFTMSILVYVFINVSDVKGGFRDFFAFSLALFLCSCGALIGDILLQKSASSISSEQANLQEGCCGVKDCRCGDACPKKIGARPVFPPNMLVSETGLRRGAYFPTKDKPKDGDSPKSGSGVENS